MNKPVNARLRSQKKDRLVRMHKNGFGDWFLNTYPDHNLAHVWEEIAAGLEILLDEEFYMPSIMCDEYTNRHYDWRAVLMMRYKKHTSRGVSPAVGIILLIGIVAIGSLGLLVVSMDMISNSEQYAENERAEQSFIELKQTMGTTATQPDVTQSVDLDIGNGGAVFKENTGSVAIEYENLEGSLTNPITFGTLEYQGGDGTVIAYEAGAIFREKGNETRIVSAPNVHYDNETNTLNFPVLEVVGDDQLGSGNIRVETQDSEGVNDVVENKTVEITIESEYWRGWEQYFIDEVGERGVIAEPHEDSNKGTVTVNLGRIDRQTPFENAVHADEEINLKGNAEVHGETTIDDSLEPVNDEIEERVATAKEEYQNVSTLTGGEYDAGKYYASEVNLNNDLKFNLSGGDAVLVVDGHITVDGGQFRVKNWDDNDLKIYTTGDLSIGSQMCLDNDECTGSFSDRKGNKPGPGALNPGQLQVYGTSSFQLDMGGGSYYEGIIYAPQGDEGDSSTFNGGNAYVDGSIVIGSVEASGTPTIDHHESLKWIDPEITGSRTQPPEITYLNLVYHLVEVEQN